jgi:hypothetical protein
LVKAKLCQLSVFGLNVYAASLSFTAILYSGSLLSGKKNRANTYIVIRSVGYLCSHHTSKVSHGQKYKFQRTADIQSAIIFHTGSKYQEDSKKA